jgi:hypothetical protein
VSEIRERIERLTLLSSIGDDIAAIRLDLERISRALTAADEMAHVIELGRGGSTRARVAAEEYRQAAAVDDKPEEA